MALKQANRALKLTTPLGEDVLLLTAFHGHEEMSRLFRYQLDMISDDNAITAADIVGKNVTFSIDLADGSFRRFNGYVSRFVAGDEDEENRRNYRAEVVPWLWFLTRTSDCRIFQKKTLPEIIEQIFGDLGFSDFEVSQIKGSHPQWEYCVQYRETDFNFVSRLMEQEGIFYFFKHEDGKHTMVLADQKGAYETCAESEVDFPRHYGTTEITDHITSWEHSWEFRTGKWAHTDYNFETPSNSLMTSEQTVVDLPGNKKYEFYDFPGEYGTTGDGTPLAKLRMEEEEVEHDVVHAASGCKSFSPGFKFSIGEHRSSGERGKSYVISSIRHSATEPMAYETGRGSIAEDYSNTFICIPDSVSFRPARATPKPVVQGCQTAVIVGPSGEEIYTDKYGRVKVQFHWDREGKKDENSSCWIRVAQNWAGKNWGIVFNPRIGQEVIVDFIEGDPDRPIITGRVYNAEQMPPYELPANQTQSTIKSRSSKGGGADNFNEIRFEDEMGSEEMYIHAEKDQNTVVENDQTIAVGNDRTESIERDRRLTVGRDKYEDVANNKAVKVGAVHTEQIGADMTVSVGSNLTETVAVNYSETVGAAMELTVGGVLAIVVGGKMSETVGASRGETVVGSKSEDIGGSNSLEVAKDSSETIKENRTEKVGKDFKQTVGGQKKVDITKEFILDAKKVQIVAKDEISIKTGKAELLMKKNGDITIKGKKINIKGSGDVIVKGSNIKEN